MTGIKSVFAVAVVTAMMSAVPADAAVLVKVMIAGSSAMWNSMAIGAYNGGSCVAGATAPCHHYTSGSNFNLTDTRPTLLGGSNINDSGALWIVWDSNLTTHVWAYIKVDSVVGTRCYFAQPRCSVNVASFPAAGNSIPGTIWGDNSSDSTPPAAVQALFTTGTKVNVAATDIRPEDGLYAQCRANATLGGGPDGLDGLGYGVNSPGICPTFGAPLSQLVGNPVLSGYPGSASVANNLAFNISGTDPFSNTAIPTPTTVSVGESPIIFITSRSGALATVKSATDSQLQTIFSGANCNASALGAAAGNIQAYLRESTSGTMNTTEYTVFRRPNADGVSQEAGVGAAKLSNSPCTAGGGRTRGIGTGEVVKGVKNSIANFGMDGIAYAFFSYGNVSSIASSSSYGYLTLNGVDGIFANYAGGDPGEPGNGTLPGVADLPASCQPGGFPCPESAIWAGGKSFPHIRDGSYRAWSVLRLVSNGTPLGNAKAVLSKSNLYVVQSTPDYVPFSPVKVTINGVLTTLDPGISFIRSHYGPNAVNSGSLEKGRDEGGCIEKKGTSTINHVQEKPGAACATYIAP